MNQLLEVRDLKVSFPSEEREHLAVRGVDFTLRKGETLGLVGESGSGKSVTALSILKLIDQPGRIVEGEIFFQGKNLLELSEGALRKIRGNRISMIFQDPSMALNPVLTLGEQLTEAILAHQKISKDQARQKALQLLGKVRIPEPEQRFLQYPHQLSGGQKQRVMIASALINDPALLIADEPTTALDMTVQSEIMQLLKGLVKEFDSSVILITHDLRVAADFCRRIAVMYAGWIVEEGPAEQMLTNPRHPYTRGLLDALPDSALQRLMAIPGQPPGISAIPGGCPFHPRCSHRIDICDKQEPPYTRVDDLHRFRCFNPVSL